METTQRLNLILKIQDKAKKEIRQGDFEMAKFLLLQVKQLILNAS